MSQEALSYYFEVLAVHLQPHHLEPLTCYLMELAEGNDIPTIHNLSHLCFPGQDPRIIRGLSDYPPVSFGELPVLAACPESNLLGTTFFHLGKAFGRSTHPQSLSRFLAGIVAPNLRYCPQCILEHHRYSLTWRFTTLKGCCMHKCYLLDLCGHCRQRIPVFPSTLQIGICPKCGGSLADCKTEALSDKELLAAQIHYDDLAFLLSPQPSLAQNAAKVVGSNLAYWREEKGWTRSEITTYTGKSRHDLYVIENGLIERGIKFSDYVEYIKCLEINFRELFGVVWNEASKPASEDQGTSYSDNEAADKKIEEAEIPLVSLNQAIQSDKQDKGSTQSRSQIDQFNRRQDEVVLELRKAVASLMAEGLPLTQRNIDSKMSITRQGLRRYPEAVELLKEIILEHKLERKKDSEQRQDELILRIREIQKCLLANNKPVTQQGIAEEIGISVNGLIYYPRVKEFLKQVVEESKDDPEQQFELRQNELVMNVQQARQKLKTAGEKVTQRAISEMVGISVTGLKRYPEVRDCLTPTC